MAEARKVTHYVARAGEGVKSVMPVGLGEAARQKVKKYIAEKTAAYVDAGGKYRYYHSNELVSGTPMPI